MTAGANESRSGHRARRLMVVGLALAGAAAALLLMLDSSPDAADPAPADPTDEPAVAAGSDDDEATAPATIPEVPPPGIDPSSAPVLSEAGKVNPFVNARTAFDVHTDDPTAEQKRFLVESFPTMLVYPPYFDQRVEWYPNGLAYLDLYAIYDDPSDPRASTHPEWILRDDEGTALYIPFDCADGSCPQFAGDPGDPAFRIDILRRIQGFVDAGYNRLFLDDVNLPVRVSDGDGETVLPVDDRTGETMTEDQWATYIVEFVELVRAEFPDLEIAHNAIWFEDSPRFTSDLLWRQIGAADHLMIERSFTDGGLVGGTGEFGFDSFLYYLDLLHEAGRGLIFLDQTAATPAEHEYNIAGYLLVNEGRDVIGTEALELLSPPRLWTGYRVDLGAATGRYYSWRGLLRRDFEMGTVLVSPPDNPRTEIDLEGTYLTLQGEPVSSITLDEREGAILRTIEPADKDS